MDKKWKIIIVGPNCVRKREVVKKIEKITGWATDSAQPETPSVSAFIQAYTAPANRIITESHFGFAAERQHQFGLSPFTFAEKKELDLIAEKNAIIILVSCKGSELVKNEKDPSIQITPVEAIEDLVLLYWMEAGAVNHIVWDNDAEKTITKLLTAY